MTSQTVELRPGKLAFEHEGKMVWCIKWHLGQSYAFQVTGVCTVFMPGSLLLAGLLCFAQMMVLCF